MQNPRFTLHLGGAKSAGEPPVVIDLDGSFAPGTTAALARFLTPESKKAR